MQREHPKKKTNEIALIFVHGLNGSRSTWTNGKNRFIDNLKKEDAVKTCYDIFTFEYHTKIIYPRKWKKFISILPFWKRTKNVGNFNLSIYQISTILQTDLSSYKQDYKFFAIVAHSMGGLIVKKALIDIYNSDRSLFDKIKLFTSLSVPHLGAQLATFGKIFIGGSQVQNLAAFSPFINTLSRDSRNLGYYPKSIFQTGQGDLIVPEASAITGNANPLNVLSTPDDHFSITQVVDKQSAVYRRLKNELSDICTLAQRIKDEKSDSPLDIEFPENSTFDFIANLIAKEVGVRLIFSGFSKNELRQKVYGRITAPNSYEALLAIRKLDEGNIPYYTIELNSSTYNITKS